MGAGAAQASADTGDGTVGVRIDEVELSRLALTTVYTRDEIRDFLARMDALGVMFRCTDDHVGAFVDALSVSFEPEPHIDFNPRRRIGDQQLADRVIAKLYIERNDR